MTFEKPTVTGTSEDQAQSEKLPARNAYEGLEADIRSSINGWGYIGCPATFLTYGFLAKTSFNRIDVASAILGTAAMTYLVVGQLRKEESISSAIKRLELFDEAAQAITNEKKAVAPELNKARIAAFGQGVFGMVGAFATVGEASIQIDLGLHSIRPELKDFCSDPFFVTACVGAVGYFASRYAKNRSLKKAKKILCACPAL